MVPIASEKRPDSLTYWVQKCRELAVNDLGGEAVGAAAMGFSEGEAEHILLKRARD